MASHHVVLTIQSQIPPDLLSEALVEAGAVGIRSEHGAGDSGAGVSRYFNFLFSDPAQPNGQRAAQGFTALCSEEHEHGWTHLRLGADDRGRHFIRSVAEAMGGEVFDQSTGMKEAFEAPARFGLRA
jgi:hypothetical protein